MDCPRPLARSHQEDPLHIAMYSAYVAMLGPCQDVVVPNIWEAPWWPAGLFPKGSAIVSRLQYLPDVPTYRESTRPQSRPERNGLIDFNIVKQKVPDMNW